jgi:hypothetical protein
MIQGRGCPLDHLVWSPLRPSYFDPEQSRMWTPRTPEDRLVALYLAATPGLLFLEVEVGQDDENCGPRRLDGLLVPGGESHVRHQGSYSRGDTVSDNL